MKSKIKLATISLVLATWLLSAQSGWAFYNPQTGRWLNRDPVQESGGLGLYAHSGNDPANRVDPLGMAHADSGLSPCRFLGSGDLENPTLGEAGFADCRLVPEQGHLLRNKGACCSFFAPGWKWEVAPVECTVKLLFLPSIGDPKKFRTLTTTAWEHEMHHGRVFAEYFRDVDALYKQWGTLCVPQTCDPIRVDFVLTMRTAYEYRKNFKNAAWQCEDVPDPTWREYFCKLKPHAEDLYTRKLAEAMAYQALLVTCMLSHLCQ